MSFLSKPCFRLLPFRCYKFCCKNIIKTYSPILWFSFRHQVCEFPAISWFSKNQNQKFFLKIDHAPKILWGTLEIFDSKISTHLLLISHIFYKSFSDILNKYCTHAIKTRSWFETLLDYNWSFLVHKLSVTLTAFDYLLK